MGPEQSILSEVVNIKNSQRKEKTRNRAERGNTNLKFTLIVSCSRDMRKMNFSYLCMYGNCTSLQSRLDHQSIVDPT